MPAPPDTLAPDALHALAALTPTLRALGDKGLTRPNTSGPRAVEATLALVAQAKRERGALAGIFIIVPPEIDDLPARALAFWAASAQHNALRDSPRGAATRQKRVESIAEIVSRFDVVALQKVNKDLTDLLGHQPG